MVADHAVVPDVGSTMYKPSAPTRGHAAAADGAGVHGGVFADDVCGRRSPARCRLAAIGRVLRRAAQARRRRTDAVAGAKSSVAPRPPHGDSSLVRWPSFTFGPTMHEGADGDAVGRARRRPSTIAVGVDLDAHRGLHDHGRELAFGGDLVARPWPGRRNLKRSPRYFRTSTMQANGRRPAAPGWRNLQLSTETKKIVFPVGSISSDFDISTAPGLGQRLDQQNTRHHRILREVPGEERLVVR